MIIKIKNFFQNWVQDTYNTPKLFICSVTAIALFLIITQTICFGLIHGFVGAFTTLGIVFAVLGYPLFMCGRTVYREFWKNNHSSNAVQDKFESIKSRWDNAYLSLQVDIDTYGHGTNLIKPLSKQDILDFLKSYEIDVKLDQFDIGTDKKETIEDIGMYRIKIRGNSDSMSIRLWVIPKD